MLLRINKSHIFLIHKLRLINVHHVHIIDRWTGKGEKLYEGWFVSISGSSPTSACAVNLQLTTFWTVFVVFMKKKKKKKILKF